jgi:aspartate beta-hydroxylase
MISAYTRHIRNCLTIRRLIGARTTENIENLFWYDLRLREAVSLRGILKVLTWRLFNRGGDKVAGNYGLVSLYFAEPGEPCRSGQNASVWNCRTLKSRPWFDEPDEMRTLLEDNAADIIAEFKNIAPRIGTHPDSNSLASQGGRWTGMFLSSTRGELDEQLCRECPVTARVIGQLPVCANFGFVAFSGMEPHTHIAAHAGSSNLRLRYHLGVEVPEPEKSRIRVDGEWRHWAQSRVHAFDDAYDHEVEHDGDQQRYILMVDVWHPELTQRDIEILSHPVFGCFGK